MHRLLKNMFLLSLRQDHFSNSTKIFLGPTPPFLYLKKVIFSVKFSKNDPLRNLRWLFSQTRMHQLPKSMFLLKLRQDYFSNYTIKFLGLTRQILYLKRCDISSQIQQKPPSQTHPAALFTDTYVTTSKKYVSTEPKTRSFQ